MPQPSLGFLPSEFSPRRRSLTPLEAAWLPCSYPPTCGDVRLDSLSPPVSPTSTLSRGCLVPPPAMGSLCGAPRCASCSPWGSCRGIVSFRQLHLLRSFSPSCESVHNWVGFPRTSRPILSWARAPLELLLHALDSRPAQTWGLDTRYSSEDSRDSEDRGPLCQVRSFLHHE